MGRMEQRKQGKAVGLGEEETQARWTGRKTGRMSVLCMSRKFLNKNWTEVFFI